MRSEGSCNFLSPDLGEPPAEDHLFFQSVYSFRVSVFVKMLSVLVLLVAATCAYGMQDLVDLAATLNETQLANIIATSGLTDTLKQQG